MPIGAIRGFQNTNFGDETMMMTNDRRTLRRLNQLSKKAIRNFMMFHYSDDRLAQLLDHARAGRLSYWSCCCFVGIATANHALRVGDVRLVPREILYGEHYIWAKALPGAGYAEAAFNQLHTTDAGRSRILIPMILAEIRRRTRQRHLADPSMLTAMGVRG